MRTPMVKREPWSAPEISTTLLGGNNHKERGEKMLQMAQIKYIKDLYENGIASSRGIFCIIVRNFETVFKKKLAMKTWDAGGCPLNHPKDWGQADFSHIVISSGKSYRHAVYARFTNSSISSRNTSVNRPEMPSRTLQICRRRTWEI